MIVDYEVDIVELKKMMIENHIDTIEQLSEKTGVNRKTLSEILSGQSYPGTMVMKKISTAMGLQNDTVGRIFFKEVLA